MQTFLPYPDFDQAASVLHPHVHLGNQFYREGIILLRGGWSNHPASRMWLDYKGVSYKGALCRYLFACNLALKKIGKSYPLWNQVVQHHWSGLSENEKYLDPPWLKDKRFCASHRSNLLRKDREKNLNWYRQFGWKEPDNLPYFWPTKEQ